MSHRNPRNRRSTYIGAMKCGLIVHRRTGRIRKPEDRAVVDECFETRTHCCGAVGEDEAQAMCSICHLEYRNEETIARLRCGHEYHPECIKKWFSRKKTCPYCRASPIDPCRVP